jgi:hypothetical protein
MPFKESDLEKENNDVIAESDFTPLPQKEVLGEDTNKKIADTRKKIKEVQENEKIEKEDYIQERFQEVKNKISRYLPSLYRDIPLEIRYEDQAEELKLYYSPQDREIVFKTPEDLSNKTKKDFDEGRTKPLVFGKEGEVSRKVQDFFLLAHEYSHAIEKQLLKEFRSKNEITWTEIRRKIALVFAHGNGIGDMFKGESFAVSMERILTEKMLEDPEITEEDKKEIGLFWQKHQKSLGDKKLSPESDYNQLDETMSYYKIYKELGEEGVNTFIENMDYRKLEKIKMYSQKELSPDCKKFLDMSGRELVDNFTKL